MKFLFNQTMCDLALVRKAKVGIDPGNRACNSRLGESQGWPLNHSPPPTTSLSPAIILGNFTIFTLCPTIPTIYTSAPTEMLEFTSVIPFKHLTTKSSDKCRYKHAFAYGISKAVNEQMVVRCLEVRCYQKPRFPPGFRETLSTYPSSLRSYRPSLLWSDAGAPYTAPPAALVNPVTSRPREPKDRLSSSPLAALGIVPGSL